MIHLRGNGDTRVARDAAALRARAGFTLWEIATVMLIIAITASLAAPAFVQFGSSREPTSSDALIKLLHDTRALAIDHSVEARLVIDPKSGHYRVDTSSSFGTGRVVEDSLRLAANEGLLTDLPRLRFVFRPTGASFGDSVTVRGSDSTRVITVDTWSGVAHAIVR